VRDQVEDATFAVLARSGTVLLTTFRTSGRAVTTPVSVTVRESRRAYIVTAADSGKAARLGRSDRVELTPSSIAGAPTGTTVAGRARPLDRSAARALGLLRPTRAVFWSWLLYRVRGHRMTFFEITPRRDQ
jgi:PPOX class probable F420-dependent enzyme